MYSGRLLQFDVAHLPSLLSGSGPVFRIEELPADDAYIVRAEAPGIDPETDVKVTTCNGRLTIRIERTDTLTGKAHSEFHYGTAARTIELPPGVDEDAITAEYDNGMLEVRVPYSTAPAVREITIAPHVAKAAPHVAKGRVVKN